MKYLHTMVRVTDVHASLNSCALGLEVIKRTDYPQGKFTLIFLAAPGDNEAQVELTQLGTRALRRWPQLQTSCVCSRRHHPLAKIAKHGDHQSSAPDGCGIRALARQHLHRTTAEGWFAAAARPWISMANTGAW
jgi:lactoylglutathione lyase